MTALTVNGSAAAATTLAAAGKLFNATGGTSGNTSTKVGTSTQFKQIFALGTATNQTGVASIPAPTDSNWHGWMWDVITLEGQSLASGTITPTFHLLASTGTTITPTVEWYKRSSGGVYTQIATVTGSSIALTTSAQALTFTAPTGIQTDFATGDKLVMWLWVNQTAGGATNSTISVVEATSGSSAGVTSEAQAVTPGYAPIPVALSVTLAGVGVLTPTLSTASGTTLNLVGAALGIDTFTRANQSGWGTASDTQTWAQVLGTGTTSIVSNEGSYTGATAQSIELLGSLTDADVDMLCRFSVSATADSVGLLARSDSGGTIGYLARYTSGNITVAYLASGATNVIGTTAFSLVAGSFYWMRLHLVGSSITAKIWLDGNDESTATTATATNTTYTAAGQFGFRIAMGGTSDIVKVDNLTVADAAARLSGIGALTATLSTASGAALSGECDGIGTLVGTFSLATALTATLPGIGTFSGVLSATLTLSTATLAGAGILTGTVQLSTALTTQLSGAGALTPALSASLSLSSVTMTGIGTLSGTAHLSTVLLSTCAGTGTLSGTPALSTALTSTMTGVGTLSGAPGATLTLAATTLAGTGTLTGTASLATNLVKTIAGIGTLTGTFSTGSGIALSALLSGDGTLSATIIPNNLVIRRGTSLLLNGVAFRFSGANAYWLGLKNLAYPTTSEIDDALQTVVEMGGTVVRSHTLGVSTGNSLSIQPFGVTYPTAAPFNATAFNTIDYAIYRAGQLGLKLIIPLTDDYHEYHGGKHDFTDYRGVVEANFYTDANVLSDFEAYISHVLNRVNQYSGVIYKNDTTIMAWETGNELSTATSAWTDTIAQYIKSIDAQHLVLVGTTIGATISNGTTAMWSLASVDILTSHFYPPNDANETTYANDAGANSKPQYAGEYDWTDTTGDTLASFLSTIEGNSYVCGDSPWSLFAHKSTNGFIAQTSGDPYALWYPGQTTAARAAQTKLRNHGFTMSGLTIPASSTPLAPTGFSVTVNSIVWHGVVGANTYDVEKSTTSSTSGFSVIGTGLTDLDTPWTDTSTTPSVRYYRVRAYNIDGVAGAYSSVVTVSYLGVTMAGVGTLTGTLTLPVATLAATIAGAGTCASSLVASLLLGGATLAGIGTLTGTMAEGTAMSSTVNGGGTLAGSMSAAATLPTTTIPGIGTFTGTAGLATSLTGTLAGRGVLTGVLGSTAPVALSSTLSGIGTLTGSPVFTIFKSGTLTGAGTLVGTATFTLTLPVVTLAGASTVTGVESLGTALASTLAGIGTLAGAAPTFKTALVSTMVGSSQVSATAQAQAALGASASGIGTVAFTLFLSTTLTVTLSGTGTLGGTTSKGTAISIMVIGLGRLTPTFFIGGVLVGTIAAYSTTSAALSFPGPSATATWVTRDLRATWKTRDLADTWKTRR